MAAPFLQHRSHDAACRLSSKRVAILELDHDELRSGRPDVLGKMHVPVTAPERSTRNRSGLRRPVRKREVERLVGEEDDALAVCLCITDFSPGPYLTRSKRTSSFSNDTE